MSVVNVPSQEQGSFLAFLYRIRFDPVVNAAFHNPATSEQVMDDFGLDSHEKQLVWQLDPPPGYPGYPPVTTDREKAQKWAELVSLLIPEFYQWTYSTPPLWW